MEDRGSLPIMNVMEIEKIIPAYQRDFVWSRKELTSFFEDLMEAFEEADEYFIGSMVFEKKHKDKFGPNKYTVVDGQQRITSLFLLFGLSLKLMKIRGHTKSQKISVLEVKLIHDEDGFPKLKSENPDVTQSFETLFDEQTTSYKNPTTSLAIKAIYDAAGTIHNLINNSFIDTDADNDRLFDFIKFVQHNVTFSYYTSRSQLESLIVFERLNSSGKSLSELEIAKGSLFIKVEDNEAEWKILKTKWAELMSLIGKSGIKADKTFIRHFIATQYKDYILSTKSKYNGNGLLKPSEMVAFITDKNAPLQYDAIKTADSLINFTKKLINLSDGKNIFGQECMVSKNISELSNSKVHNILILQSKDKTVYDTCSRVSLAQTTINKLLGKYVGGTEKRFETWSKLVFEGYENNHTPEMISKNLSRAALKLFQKDWIEIEPRFKDFVYDTVRGTLCLHILELSLDQETGANSMANGLASAALQEAGVDHIEPQSSSNFNRFGGHNIGNLALLLKNTNSSIQNKTLSTETRKNAYQNSIYYSTKFIVSAPGTYKGKEGIANNRFPKAADWDASQVDKRRELIQKYVKDFTLGYLENVIS